MTETATRQVRLNRRREDQRRYEATVSAELPVQPGKTRVEPQTVTVTETIVSTGGSESSEIRVMLNVERYRKDGEVAFGQLRRFDITAGRYIPRDVANTFTAEAIATIAGIRAEAMEQFGLIDWEAQR